MDENYLAVGDLVKVINLDGATGQMIRDRFGTIPVFEVIKIDHVDRRAEKHLASIKPPGSSEMPILAHWERLEKVVRTTLPELDMDLDEIHRAQALMEG